MLLLSQTVYDHCTYVVADTITVFLPVCLTLLPI